MTTPVFILPAEFDPADYLDGSLRRHHDNSRWFVSTILRKWASRPRRQISPVALNSVILKRMMGYRYSDIINALLAGNVVRSTSDTRTSGMFVSRLPTESFCEEFMR